MDEIMKKFVGDSDLWFVTTADMRMSQDQLVLKFSSGSQEYLYAFHTLHAKRLMLVLKENIEEYEKVLGELKTDLQRPIPSPTQIGQKEGMANAFFHI